jgi:Subtilase family
LAANRQHHRAPLVPGRTSHRGRALPGRFGRCALAALISTAALLFAFATSTRAEEVFTSQAAAANATDSTWIPAPPRRAAVCIVDTGTDHTPDTSNVVARFAMDGSDGSDISPVKHGTLMATIASAPKNDFGMVGAAPSVDVVSVRASRDGISFGALDVQAAIQLCVSKRLTYNIKVLSLSLGGNSNVITASTKQRNEFQDAIDNARLHAVNVVAAAGNTARAVADWPAGYGPAFAVGASTSSGERCSFASWGSEVDLWAPGCPLDVGRPDSTGTPAWAKGSSEATAFVAAVLAQIRGFNSQLSVDDAERALRAEARPDEAGAFLDVAAALSSVGLTAALSVGHASIPQLGTVPSGAGVSQSHVDGPSSAAPSAIEPGRTATQRPLSVGLPASNIRPAVRLAPPVVRTATIRNGLLTLALKDKSRSVEAHVEIYSRRRGKPFPSIAKRLRFRADTLRIRFSGSISQLSIGYRDPTGVRGRSTTVVVHPKSSARIRARHS